MWTTHNARQHLARALSRHGIGPPEPRQNQRGPPPPPSINTDTRVDAWLQPNAVGQYQHTPQFEQTLSNKLQGIAHAGFPVVVVLDRKSYDMYSAIKRVAEIRLGIKTICVTAAALYRADRSGHLDLQTSSNIALKFNLKSAGICHEVQLDDLALLKPGGQCNTIVIGADVAHSTATAAPGCPSIASVVGSTDARFMHFPGSMRLQRNRKEDIVDLAEMVKERLLDWAAKNGGRRLPQNMLFYRDGVSESQYDIIRRRELPAIQLGINRAHNVLNNNRQAPADVPDTFSPPPEQKRSGKREVDVDDFNLQLKRWEEERADLIEKPLNNVPMNVTFVVVGKRHNVRFYSTTEEQWTHHNPRNANQNVKPGLAVDQVITHPFNMDFYLQSHNAIKGTARSAHYVVVQYGMGLAVEQLQNITHSRIGPQESIWKHPAVHGKSMHVHLYASQ